MANSAKLLIRVDEEPSPQFLLNVNFVIISDPFNFKKSVFTLLIQVIIFFNLSDILSEDEKITSRLSLSNSQLNHISSLLS